MAICLAASACASIERAALRGASALLERGRATALEEPDWQLARIDLAYALNRGPGASRWVLSITGGQAFSLFNSASARVDQAPASRLN